MDVNVELLAEHRVVVAVSGPLDLATAPDLARVLRTEAPGRDVIVDLSAATFIDSTGLAVLLNASRRCVGRGNHMLVACPYGDVFRMFELAALLETLRVVDTVADAVAGLDAAQRGPFRSV